MKRSVSFVTEGSLRKTKLFRFLSGICALLALNPYASAALLAQYPISASNGADNPLSAINVDADISASTLHVVGATAVHTPLGAGGFIANGWGGTLDTGKYFEFVLTPQSGNAITFDTITYALVRTPNASSMWQLHASTDGFASSDLTLASHDISASANASQVLFSGLDISSIGTQSGAVTFRLYGWGTPFSGGFANSTANPGIGSDILIDGAVAPVPEPSQYGLIAAVGAMGVGLLSCLKRPKKLAI